MSRLIDADALIKKALDEAFFDSAAEDIFCELVETAPTIYAVEVVHGRWEKEPPYTSLGGEYKKALICSECHSFFVSDGNKPWQLHNYCPNCGAKMAKGENHEID